ncbi:hypothetical protein BDQ12DRAFT_676848 [Crucibulum laeve]|uniref:Transcription activator of gluconeogenesis ERT1 n=1 Tax=Crucibulum laeve TaxID=68775 RepID=A0A5C3MDI8_9AGAR|nr:hypothetical protein BDQ12DRAFT_676848 [Crucibulum laeve]
MPDLQDPVDPPPQPVQPQMHNITYSTMPMHMYPFPPGLMPQQHLSQSKRRQVKNACTNCQRACKKCDDARPCLRCVKYGISEECVDSQRKERKRGVKRGPYKKRDGKTRASSLTVDQPELSQQQQPSPPTNVAVSPPMNPPPANSYIQVGFPPPGTYYSQYPPPPIPRPGEPAPVYHPQYYVVPSPMPPSLHPGQEGDAHGYPPQSFYPTYVASFPHPIPYPYMVPRPDGQVHIQNQYAIYPSPIYQKQAPSGGEITQEASRQNIEGQEDLSTDNQNTGS